jgi:2-pyrone-4,6-dicarboxylate lactonase
MSLRYTADKVALSYVGAIRWCHSSVPFACGQIVEAHRNRRVSWPQNSRMTKTLPPRPGFDVPAGACNAHVHVFGPRERFPYDTNAPTPPAADAPKDMLYALNQRLGLQRCVVVQSIVHGYDNRATEDALAARPGSYRGVALLPPGVDTAELHRLHAAGFRGVRYNFMGNPAGWAPMDEVLTMAARIERLGWHLQIHGEPHILMDFGPALRRSPVPVVIDHMGRIDASLGFDQPHFRALLALLDDPRFWVKVSGCDRITRQGAPYADAVPYARKLVAEFGERALWGTDWPHPSPSHGVPDDLQLLELLMQIAPTGAERQALLVDNPQRLYRFEATAPAG